jgi:hypothetical protein
MATKPIELKRKTVFVARGGAHDRTDPVIPIILVHLTDSTDSTEDFRLVRTNRLGYQILRIF